MGSFFARHQEGLQTVTDFFDQAQEFEAAHGDVRKALQEGNRELVSRGQWVEAALRVQAFSTEMLRMAGVPAAINKSDMTRDEKLKANDSVAEGMLAVAKLGLAAMQQAKNAAH